MIQPPTLQLTLPPGRTNPEELMRYALSRAKLAEQAGEVPVGALLLDEDGSILAEAGNGPLSLSDPTAHAEILALRHAAKIKGNYRLPGTILVTTLEPCLMCYGAMVQARIAGLIFGARDPKAGVIVSHTPDVFFLNHSFPYIEGTLAEECSTLLSDFFRKRRIDIATQRKPTTE